MKTTSKILLSSILGLASNCAISAEQDDELWGDDWEEQGTQSWRGYLEYGFGKRLSSDPLFDNQQTLNEIKLYIENDIEFDQVELKVKAEGWYDGVLERYKGEVRELSLNFSAFGNTDFTLGRQVTTWGTGDLLFVNDQFPKGWNAYFNGRDDNYVKAPANAIRINSYFDSVNLDFVWTPEFTPDKYINGDRFSFFSPMVQTNVGGENVINDVEPESKFSNGEFALRLYKTIDGVEYALYGYKGFDKRPLGVNEELKPTYHKRNLWGASVRGSAWDGLYNVEMVYEDAREDANGTNPLVNNSLWKLLIGYETELLPKLNIGFQYYLEWIDDYNNLMANSPFPQYEPEEKRQWLTNRITYRALQDKLTWTLFSFYSLTDKEHFLRWNVNYRQDDNWSYTLGLNLIDGKENHTFFNQFEKASNIYFRLRYNF
ncbi:MAG: hypothetical protein HWD86_11280 [Kangiellaceae bacterium]|nr:hypothetical protein [Kangiellaceae bacterium]